MITRPPARYLPPMNWVLARERLGAELIGAREQITLRFRLGLREHGALASALLFCAPELVLQAGAGLADGMPREMPWRRCGGLLRIDAHDQGRALSTELTALFKAMAQALAKFALTDEEERLARAALGEQLEAALRGAAAEVRCALLEESIDDPALRFSRLA